MKNLKKKSAIFLVAIGLVLALPVTTVLADDTDMRYGRKKLGEMSNGNNLQYVYDKFVEGCANANAEIRIDINGRNIDFNKDLELIYNMFYSDYPEYFWVRGDWSAASNGSTLTMKPVYTMTGSELTSTKSAYNNKVNELTSGLSGSNYDKAKTLHDRLIDTVTYTSTSNDQNAYGALVEGKAVCNGYARAYQHLLLKAGIPAWYVRGSSTNPSTNKPEGHAWNIVKIDGQWYYTDVTWDDQGADTFYAYFNITTQQLLKDHAIESTYLSLVPQATATVANYYIKEGRSFDSYDQAKLVALLKKDSNTSQIYINGDINSFISSINLKSIAIDLGATGNYSVSSSTSNLGNAIILNLVVVQGDHIHKAERAIEQVNATCLSNGTKAYYVCNCGLKFLDIACTNQVTSDSQLEITASTHAPSGWKKNTTSHWKECTQCGNETANTRGNHSDSNTDNKCDTCGYSLPVADESGYISVNEGTSGSGNSNTNNSNSTDGQAANQNADNPNSDSSINSGVVDENQDIDNTQSTDNEELISSDGPSYITDEISSLEEADSSNDEKTNNSTLIWLLIGGVAIVVVASVVIAVLLIKKKKSQ